MKNRCSSVYPLELSYHSATFTPRIINVTDGVYVAIGYGLANSILIEGNDGVIIIDTLESVAAARPVRQLFRRITKKPVKAIIYTHYHSDHIGGAGVFAADNNDVEIITSDETVKELNNVSLVGPILYKRAMGMYGQFLPRGWYINDGIGPFLKMGPHSEVAYLPPTRTFSTENLNLCIAGVRLQLIRTPGETNGELAVWLPDLQLIIGADNFYHSFPNLYSIRGTKRRNLYDWANSIEKMRKLSASYYIPCHTQPLEGKSNIDEVLSNYRDAICFLRDQGLQRMNTGMTPDELTEDFELPFHLRNLPYLREYYGNVKWSLRNLYNGYLGWFDGNSAHLCPLPDSERAERMSELVGGDIKLLKQAEKALLNLNYQWALELSDYLLHLPKVCSKGLHIRGQALQGLGLIQGNSCGRNYYLTQALESYGTLRIPPLEGQESIFINLDIDTVLKIMAINLSYPRTQDVTMAIKFNFTDIHKCYTLNIRKGVAIVLPYILDDLDLEVSCSSMVWKKIVGQYIPPRKVVAQSLLEITKGSAVEFIKFLSYFNRPM